MGAYSAITYLYGSLLSYNIYIYGSVLSYNIYIWELGGIFKTIFSQMFIIFSYPCCACLIYSKYFRYLFRFEDRIYIYIVPRTPNTWIIQETTQVSTAVRPSA